MFDCRFGGFRISEDLCLDCLSCKIPNEPISHLTRLEECQKKTLLAEYRMEKADICPSFAEGGFPLLAFEGQSALL